MDKMKLGRIIAAFCAALFSGAALAQLALPVGSVPGVDLPKIPVNQSDIDLLSPELLGRVLEQARVERLSRFVRQNRKVVDLDENRNPVVRGELIASGIDDTSIAAAQRLGFSFESVFRNAIVYKGRNRDTAWYSITDAEWPAIRVAFEQWLAPENFDAHGSQRVQLRWLTAPLLRAVG